MFLTEKTPSAKKSSKIKAFSHSKKYFCEYLTRADHLGRVVNTVLVRPFAPARGKARNIFELESLLSAAHFSFSVACLIYFPLLILASVGFGASSGIAQE